ncbi:MAG: ribonuclease P protein component [Eubacteriales bacterium]|nr:ribonuclease P protein component [Eubacteriales bacterium]
MKYKYFETLRKNSEFKNVYNIKKSFANRYLIMYIKENGTDTNRLGVSVSKKVGNSIVRHRLARLIREAFRLNISHIPDGYDVIFVARAGLKDKGYFETESAMLHLFKLHGIYVDNVER